MGYIGVAMRLAIPLMALGLVVGMLLPGGAAADDRTLRDAGQSRDAQFMQLGREALRASRVFNRSRGRRGARRLLRAFRATRKEIKALVPAVRAQQPSTPHGDTYKRLLLLSVRELDASLRLDIRAVRAIVRGEGASGGRLAARAYKYAKRSQRHERQAIRAIKRSLG